MKKKTKVKAKTKWQKLLTVKQLRHLKENGVTSLASFRQTVDFQNKQREKFNLPVSPCFDCNAIFNRLTEGEVKF